MAETRLVVRIDNERPVELAALAGSFSALADEYTHFLQKQPDAVLVPDVRLYVEKVESGSIVATLIALSPLALPLVENANSVVQFAQYAKTGLEYLVGRIRDRPASLDNKSLSNLCTFLEPVARDNAAQLNMNVSGDMNVTVNVHLNAVEANAAQNNARRQLELSKAPVTGEHRKVLLYLHQARDDLKSSVGDRGIIESIHPGPVKVVFGSEGIKSQIVRSSENPFRSAYVVDVEVGTVRGRPMLYTVTALHEVVERPSEPEAA